MRVLWSQVYVLGPMIIIFIVLLLLQSCLQHHNRTRHRLAQP